MRPLKPLGPVRDTRYLLFVRTVPDIQDPDSGIAKYAGCYIYPIGTRDDLPRKHLESAFMPPNVDAWQQICSYGDRLLIVFSDAARDLALLGEPPGFTRTVAQQGEIAPHVVRIEYRANDVVRFIRDDLGNVVDTVKMDAFGSGWHRAIDVMQLGNIHPAGTLAHMETRPARWVERWATFLKTYALGRMDHTIARQALRSLRHRVTPQTTLWQHTDHELHSFEYQVRREQRPIRVSPRSGKYEHLFHLDFNAFYPRIMADNPMPGECIAFFDAGVDVQIVEEMIANDRLVLARVLFKNHQRRRVATAGMEEILATFHRDDITIVQCAVYKRNRAVSDWAKEMLTLRGLAPIEIRPAVKALSVALWGKLTQRNYQYVDITDEVSSEDVEELVQAREVGAEAVDFGDAIRKLSFDGRVLENRPDAWAHDRWHAIGAHVLEHGRMIMQEFMEGCDVVYAHTDSIYSAISIPTANEMPEQNGDLFDYHTLHNVELDGGDRLVDGNYEAQHGTTRNGQYWVWPHDVQGAEPNTAYYRVIDE